MDLATENLNQDVGDVGQLELLAHAGQSSAPTTVSCGKGGCRRGEEHRQVSVGAKTSWLGNYCARDEDEAITDASAFDLVMEK